MDRDSPTRIAVLGGGAIATAIHLPNLRRRKDARVVAVAEPDAGRRAAALAIAPGARPVEDWRQTLDPDEVDAVLVCLPTPLLATAAAAALHAGLHAYIEKPFAATMDDARTVIAAAESTGRVAMVGFHMRFNPVYEAARNALRRGAIGPLVALRTTFSAGPGRLPEWKRAVASGGGVLLDLASHHADLARFLTGQDVAEVSALIRTRHSDQDTALVALRMADDTLVEGLFAFGSCEEDALEAFGETGRMTAQRYLSLAPFVHGPAAAGRRRAGMAAAIGSVRRLPYLLARQRTPGHEPGYRLALERFLDVARGRDLPFPGLEDGRRALEVVLAAEAAAAGKRVVSIVPAAAADATTR